MTPGEMVAYVTALRDKAATAAPDCAEAMGQVHQRYLVNVTLALYKSVPMVETPSAPGQPPASMTGALRRSVTCSAAMGSGVTASSYVGPHTIYAATQEWGGVHTGRPHMWLWIRYIGAYEVKRRGWVKERVHIPARPYMRPSRDDVIANGSVQAAANASFMKTVFG